MIKVHTECFHDESSLVCSKHYKQILFLDKKRYWQDKSLDLEDRKFTPHFVFILISLTLCIRENRLTGTFTNIEDPDELPHHAAFHRGLHCL